MMPDAIALVSLVASAVALGSFAVYQRRLGEYIDSIDRELRRRFDRKQHWNGGTA